MEGQVIFDIGVKAFEASKAAFLKAYNADRFTEDKDSTFRMVFEPKLEDSKVEDGKIRINLSAREGLDCYITIVFEPDSNMLSDMAEVCIKKLNKMRALLEAAS